MVLLILHVSRLEGAFASIVPALTLSPKCGIVGATSGHGQPLVSHFGKRRVSRDDRVFQRVDSAAMTKGRALLIASLTIFGGATEQANAAEPTEAGCVETYEDALAHKKRGALTAAHKRFAECTQPACPAPVREECTGQVRKLAALIPTIVPSARTTGGEELVEVRVQVDGKVLTEKLDGRAHQLDPGPHTFRFETGGFPAQELRAVLAEGERLRKVEAVFDSGEKPAEQPIPTLVYVLGGIGIAGLAGFTYFGLSGLSQESDLDSQGCEPNCSQGDTDDLKRTYLFADISLAIGIAGLGGATYLYVSSRGDGKSEKSPTLDGRVFGIGGVF
jgi:hypothetical protein